MPPDQPAGVYQGELAITSASGFETQVPMQLTVRDFGLPSTSTLASAFGMDFDVCPGQFNGPDCFPNERRGWALKSLYVRVALENRVTISNSAFQPPVGHEIALFRRHLLPLLQGGSPQNDAGTLTPVRLAGAQLTSIQVDGGPFLNAGAALRSQRRLHRPRLLLRLRRAGPRPQAVGGVQAARALGAPLARPRDAGHGADPGGRPLQGHAAAGHPGADCQPHRRQTALALRRQPAAGLRPLPGQARQPAVALQRLPQPRLRRRRAGEGPYFAGWPSYVIDQPAFQHRAMGVLAFAYAASGELYFQTTHALRTAWTRQYFFGGNGDGTLFYPGRPSLIGGSSHIPVESSA